MNLSHFTGIPWGGLDWPTAISGLALVDVPLCFLVGAFVGLGLRGLQNWSLMAPGGHVTRRLGNPEKDRDRVASPMERLHKAFATAGWTRTARRR